MRTKTSTLTAYYIVNYVLRENRTSTPVCFANQNVLIFQVLPGAAHKTSKFLNTCVTTLPISIIEMFFPIQVRVPAPN